MYSLAWLVVVGVTAAVAGAAVGYLVAQVRSQARERIQDLEAELGKAQDELAGYRREVFEQFAETARKFKTLDESYSDLHRQLASSASLLCGEAAGPLLAGPADAPEITAQPEGPSVHEPQQPDPLDAPRAGSDSVPDAEEPIVVAEAEETETGAGPQIGDGDASAADEEASPRTREAG
jgi:uncharacterized membrane-anchored protein YhcB (DUF1043 family)